MQPPIAPAGSLQSENAWRVLILLFLINLLNFFDRAIPAVVLEPMRLDFGLTDLQLGIISAAFTVVYAIAGIPLGRLSDNWSRKKVLAAGLTVWSGLTAATGAAWNYTSLLIIRMGVGIGEASCGPASNSLIGDLFPPEKRARAIGIFMLGLPLGLCLAFFTVGALVKAFDGNWRVPFYLAAIPGFVLAILVLLVKEPERGAADAATHVAHKVDKPIRQIMSNKTMWWITLSGVSINFAAYSVGSFMVALLQRYYGLDIAQAALVTGFIIGVTGLVSLTLGARISDYMHTRSETGRLNYGGVALVVAAISTFLALGAKTSVTAFALLFSLGWLTYYVYYTTAYPAIQDVVEPRLRGTAMAMYFAGVYLLGGAFGSVIVGALSDHYALVAMQTAGASEMTETFKAVGLHSAMYLVPVSLLVTAVLVFAAAKTFRKDHEAMQAKLR